MRPQGVQIRDGGYEVRPVQALLWAVTLGALATAVVLLFFAQYQRAMGETLTLGGDNQLIQFPLSYEAWRGWSQGRIPEWTTRLWSGYPLLADPIGGPLYVPHMLAFALTSPPHLSAYDLSTAFHAGVLTAGAAFLVQLLGAGRAAAALAAVLFLLAPFSHQWAVHLIPQYSALAYWPWLFAAAEMLGRGTTRALGAFAWLGWLALASQAVAGYPEFALYSGLVAALWIVVLGRQRSLRSRLLRTVVLGVGGLALAAPQLMTTAAVLAQSIRGKGPDPALAQALSVSWDAWLLPALGERARQDPQWTFLGYAALGFALVAVARRGRHAWFLGAVALGGYLLALGPQTPLYPALHALPPFTIFRGPLKFWQLTEVSVALLAALGADSALRAARSGEHGRWLAPVVLLLIAVTVLERATFTATHMRQVVRFRAGETPRQGAMIEQLRASGLLDLARAVPMNRTLFTGFPELRFGSLNVLADVDSLRGGPAQLLGPFHQRLASGNRQDLLRLAGVRFVVGKNEQCVRFASGRQWRVVQRHGDLCLLERSVPLARYQLLSDFEAFASTDEMVGALRGRAPRNIGVVLEAAAESPIRGTSGEVKVLSEAPGALQLRVVSSGPGLLFVRESWAPGWQSFVDQAPVPLHRAGGIFFAVEVPPGRHLVEIVYRARGLRAGVLIALCWAIGALLLGVKERRRRADSGARPS